MPFDLEAAFAEVAALAARCRYRDCRHRGEPGCAVAAAVAEGTLARDRLASLRKLEDEQQALAARRDERLAVFRKAGERSASRALKRFYKKGLLKLD